MTLIITFQKSIERIRNIYPSRSAAPSRWVYPNGQIFFASMADCFSQRNNKIRAGASNIEMHQLSLLSMIRVYIETHFPSTTLFPPRVWVGHSACARITRLPRNRPFSAHLQLSAHPKPHRPPDSHVQACFRPRTCESGNGLRGGAECLPRSGGWAPSKAHGRLPGSARSAEKWAARSANLRIRGELAQRDRCGVSKPPESAKILPTIRMFGVPQTSATDRTCESSAFL